jgi:hypothetical protein
VATAISVANFEAALGECYDAVVAGNVADAVKWRDAARIQFDGLSSSLAGDGFSKTRRASLEGTEKAVDALIRRSTSGGLYEVHSRWTT